jgi:predicted phage tail protein
MGRGLYYANDAGKLDEKTITWVVEARAIDDDDQPAGDWIVLGSESKTDSTNTPIRLSMRYTLAAPGRYEVRLRRTDEKDTSSRAGHEIRWGGLKAFINGPDVFEDVSLLLVKMRATDNLSQRSARQINVIQTRKIPVWDDVNGGWTQPQPTRSIVWAAVDVCRAKYGGGWGDERLIIPELQALDAKLAVRGDRFDGVFDTKTTVWDGVSRVVRCGRSVPVQQGNLIRVVRDEPQEVPTAMFGPRNIVKGSFNLSYIMPSEETADSVTVEYFNQRTWSQAEVLAKLADSSGEKAATVPFFGIVDRDHALREGMAIAADNRYRRRSVNFRTEKDGIHLTYGDLIAVTHPMPRWGAGGGEVEDWDPDTGLMTLSEPVAWQDGQEHYIALRLQNGKLGAELLCQPGNHDRQVRIVDDMPAGVEPYVGYEAERTYFAFGVGTNWGRLCKVRLVQPRENGAQTEITAIVDDDRVYIN